MRSSVAERSTPIDAAPGSRHGRGQRSIADDWRAGGDTR